MLQSWTDEERSFIRDHWREMDDAQLAAALRRPMSSVSHIRLKLGLKRPRHTGKNVARYRSRDHV
jgi:hypothetical protein